MCYMSYVNFIKEPIFKGKDSLLELEKDFIELTDIELKDREVKIKKEIEEPFFKPIMVSIDDMDKFKQKEMNKIRSIKNTWYNWLVNYVTDPIRKRVASFKNKAVSLFNPNTPKQTVYGRGKKVSQPKTQNTRKSFLSKEKKIKQE